MILTFSKWHRVFRTNDWWNYVIPPILGFYFVGKLECSDHRLGLDQIVLVFMLMVCIASFGYFLGEWTDIGDDLKAGKKNTLEHSTNSFRSGILLLNTLAIVGLCYFLKLNYGQIAFVVIQIVCFILYSVPPFRLKRNLFSSAVLESIYSGTVMYLLVLSVHVNIESALFLLLAVWGAMKGLRNYILHTIKDAENDSKANVKTLGNHYSESVLLHFIRTFLLPVEMLSLAGFFLLLSFPLNWVFFSFYAASVGYSIWHQSKSEVMSKFGFLININLFHELVLLILCLVMLAFFNPEWILLVVIALLVFNTYIKWIVGLYQYLKRTVTKLFNV